MNQSSDETQEQFPSDDRLLASAAQFLVDGHDEDAASVLLACQITHWESGDTWMSGDEEIRGVHFLLTGPRSAWDVLSDPRNPVTVKVRAAFEAVLPSGYYVRHFEVKVQLVDIDPDWRTELLEIARGKGIHNQAVRDYAITWKSLRFRSKSEVRIADALDQANVLFFANCLSRLGLSGERVTREADFLVCEDGKWGVLEVDGEPFHPPSRTAQDHARDRLFRDYGIRLVEHFNATECYNAPDQVVARFLGLLRKT